MGASRLVDVRRRPRALEQADDKLATSDSFNDLTDRGAELFVGPLSDMVGQVMVGEVDPSAPRLNYVTVAQAVAANGKLRAASDGGVEIAEAASRITGHPTIFVVGQQPARTAAAPGPPAPPTSARSSVPSRR